MLPESSGSEGFPQLEAALRKFLEESLRLLRELYGDPPVWPEAPFRETEYRDSVSRRLSTVVKAYPGGAVLQLWSPRFMHLDTVRAAVGELDKLSKQGRAVGQFSQDLGYAYLVPFLNRYLCLSPGGTFEQSAFDTAYADLEAYLAADTLRGRLFIELCDLTGDVSEVLLSPTHTIFILDIENATALSRLVTDADEPLTSFMDFKRGRPSPRPGSYVMAADLSIPKRETNKLSLVLASEARRCVLAYRLCHAGTGDLRFLDYEYHGFVPTIGRFGLTDPLRVGTFGYALNGEVAGKIAAAWPRSYQLASKMEPELASLKSPLAIATARYSASHEKVSKEDRLLDYVIALEALYGGGGGDISYRVSLRLAIALGKTPAERRDLFGDVGLAYRERNGLVHGSGPLPSNINLHGHMRPVDEFLREIQGYLLRSIHLFLEAEGKSLRKEQVLSLIDDSIVGQEAFGLG